MTMPAPMRNWRRPRGSHLLVAVRSGGIASMSVAALPEAALLFVCGCALRWHVLSFCRRYAQPKAVRRLFHIFLRSLTGSALLTASC